MRQLRLDHTRGFRPFTFYFIECVTGSVDNKKRQQCPHRTATMKTNNNKWKENAYLLHYMNRDTILKIPNKNDNFLGSLCDSRPLGSLGFGGESAFVCLGLRLFSRANDKSRREGRRWILVDFVCDSMAGEQRRFRSLQVCWPRFFIRRL